MNYKVVFSLEAAAELVGIMGVLDPVSVLSAAETVRKALEHDP